MNIAEIPSGIISDTYGRKNSLLIAFALYILSFVIFYFSRDFSLLLVAIIFNGLGDAFRSGTHKGMIMDYLKQNNWESFKIDYYGHTRSWSQIGSAISAIFAGVIVLYTGDYRKIYLLAIVPYMINFINICNYPESINYSKGQRKSQAGYSIISVFQNFITNLRKTGVFRIINSTALHSAYLKAIKDYIQAIMLQVAIMIPILLSYNEKQKSGLVIGVLYFIIFLLTSRASKNAGRLMQSGIKNLSMKTLALGLLFGSLCGILVMKELWVPALVLFVFIYLIENIRKPILTGFLSDEVPNEILASVLSAQSFYQTIITSVLAIGFGYTADHFGLGVSLLSISVVLFLFISLSRMLPNPNKKT